MPSTPAPNAQPPRKNDRYGKLSSEQVAQLAHLIKQQPLTDLSDETISIMVGCSRQTVIRHKASLRAAQNIPEEPEPSSASPEGSAIDLLAQYADIKTLTPEQTMKLLTVLATTSPNTASQINALTTLERLRESLTKPEDRGPPEPYSVEERVDRLAAIMDSQGLQITRLAIEKNWPDESKENPEPVRVAPALAEPNNTPQRDSQPSL